MGTSMACARPQRQDPDCQSFFEVGFFEVVERRARTWKKRKSHGSKCHVQRPAPALTSSSVSSRMLYHPQQRLTASCSHLPPQRSPHPSSAILPISTSPTRPWPLLALELYGSPPTNPIFSTPTRSYDILSTPSTSRDVVLRGRFLATLIRYSHSRCSKGRFCSLCCCLNAASSREKR